MHSLIHSIHASTANMIAQLDDVTEEQIILFIDQREQLVQQLLKMVVTEVEQQRYGEIVREVLQHDSVINAKLEEFRSGASEGIQKVSAARVQNTAYSSPYTPDSYYFDKTK